MHSAHSEGSQPQVPPSLATLPFDILSTVIRRVDLVSIARLRCTCQTFASPGLYSSIPDFRILQAVTAGDIGSFRQALSESAVIAKPLPSPSEADLIHYRRRRHLLQACVWHLVCTHNELSPVWWAPLDLLYDVTKVYLRDLDYLDKTNGVGKIITDTVVLKGLDQLHTATEQFLERMLAIAVDRRHSLGLTSFSSYCVRNKAWLESLDLYDTLIAITEVTDAPEQQLVDMQLALSPFAWFGNDGGDACDNASEWLASSGHPLVFLNAVRLFANNENDHSSATLYSFPDLVHALWTAGHKQLVFQFLDLVLFALGTRSVRYYASNEADADPLLFALGQRVTRPTMALPLSFPAGLDAASVQSNVFRPFILAGASQDLIQAAALSIYVRRWFDMGSWFHLDQYTHSPDRELLDWYLVRKPLDLDLVHSYCHDLAAALRTSHSGISSAALQRMLEEIPFDVVRAKKIQGDRYSTKCDRCEQLKQLAQQPGASALLKRFVKVHDASPMSFAPIPPDERAQEARAIQALLGSIPPPSSAASSAESHSWRAFLGSFVAERTSYGNTRLPLLWPHVRDADPDTALNAVPFGEFMRAMIQGRWLSEAMEVLEEAKQIERFADWRISLQELVGMKAPVDKDESDTDEDELDAGLDEFVDYVEQNGWLVVQG